MFFVIHILIKYSLLLIIVKLDFGVVPSGWKKLGRVSVHIVLPGDRCLNYLMSV